MEIGIKMQRKVFGLDRNPAKQIPFDEIRLYDLWRVIVAVTTTWHDVMKSVAMTTTWHDVMKSVAVTTTWHDVMKSCLKIGSPTEETLMPRVQSKATYKREGL
jgi:hypothetical protein